MQTKKNSQQCPVCEGNNNCQVNTKTCWCTKIDIDLIKLRDLIGEERSRCICNNCLQRLKLPQKRS